MSDNKRHVHAGAMLEYALDALKTNEPWKLWELSSRHQNYWESLASHPAWIVNVEYRRKPEMIAIGKVSFPKPINEAPPVNTLCYVVAIHSDMNILNNNWHNNSVVLNTYLKRGLIHLTEDAAQQHLDALIKINKGEF
ncbi:hypothetical protein [Photorhabdus khanii]|uniref:Uncharacterized protein n=1 Tax=Photorhabdus khanii subsp. guanajuatensis TaxID=2100166 RepID=A0A4R4IM03_9GAMM|nr:hypothetical protein [Photorhabdus khanii]TDB41251.1 hypothetical protein C5467_24605 [Photorhabdus khanii subsp. guanajuatensis]